MFSCRFLQEAAKVSEVAYSKYHSLFFMRLLNLCGFFSRSKWNLTQIAASCGESNKESCWDHWGWSGLERKQRGEPLGQFGQHRRCSLAATVVRGKWRAVAACHKLVAHVARCRFVGAFIMHASALKRSCRGKDRARQRQRKSVGRGHVGLSMCKWGCPCLRRCVWVDAGCCGCCFYKVNKINYRSSANLIVSAVAGEERKVDKSF